MRVNNCVVELWLRSLAQTLRVNNKEKAWPQGHALSFIYYEHGLIPQIAPLTAPLIAQRLIVVASLIIGITNLRCREHLLSLNIYNRYFRCYIFFLHYTFIKVFSSSDTH